MANSACVFELPSPPSLIRLPALTCPNISPLSPSPLYLLLAHMLRTTTAAAAANKARNNAQATRYFGGEVTQPKGKLAGDLFNWLSLMSLP